MVEFEAVNRLTDLRTPSKSIFEAYAPRLSRHVIVKDCHCDSLETAEGHLKDALVKVTENRYATTMISATISVDGVGNGGYRVRFVWEKQGQMIDPEVVSDPHPPAPAGKSAYQKKKQLYSNPFTRVQVWEGWSQIHSCSVILKCFSYIKFTYEVNDQLKEAFTQARVSHPCVCRLMDICVFFNKKNHLRVYLVMEKMTANLQTDVLDRRRDGLLYPESSLWLILQHISSGLLHAKSKVKIADFGSSWQKVINSLTNSAQGTLDYLSPEARGAIGGLEATLRPFASDIYSLGLTMLHLAKLSLPAGLSSEKGSGLRSILEGEIEGLNYTAEFKDLISHMVAFDPQNRPGIAAVHKEAAQRVSSQSQRDCSAGEIARLTAEGRSCKREGRFEEAKIAMEKAWRIAVECSHGDTAILGRKLGRLLGVHLGRTEEAKEVILRSLEVAEELEPTSKEVVALRISLIRTSFYNGSNPDVISAVYSLLDEHRILCHDCDSYWSVVYYLYMSLRRQSQSDQAESQFALLSQDRSESEQPKSRIYRLHLEAIVKLQRQNYFEAEKRLAEVEQTCARLFPTSLLRAANYSLWGNLYYILWRRDEALSMYAKGWDLLAQTSPVSIHAAIHLSDWAAILHNLGQAGESLGKYEAAQALFARKYAYCEQAGQNAVNLARAYIETGQRESAVERLREAIKVYERLGKTEDIVKIKKQLAATGKISSRR